MQSSQGARYRSRHSHPQERLYLQCFRQQFLCWSNGKDWQGDALTLWWGLLQGVRYKGVANE